MTNKKCIWCGTRSKEVEGLRLALYGLTKGKYRLNNMIQRGDGQDYIIIFEGWIIDWVRDILIEHGFHILYESQLGGYSAIRFIPRSKLDEEPVIKYSTKKPKEHEEPKKKERLEWLNVETRTITISSKR